MFYKHLHTIGMCLSLSCWCSRESVAYEYAMLAITNILSLITVTVVMDTWYVCMHVHVSSTSSSLSVSYQRPRESVAYETSSMMLERSPILYDKLGAKLWISCSYESVYLVALDLTSIFDHGMFSGAIYWSVSARDWLSAEQHQGAATM